MRYLLLAVAVVLVATALVGVASAASETFQNGGAGWQGWYHMPPSQSLVPLEIKPLDPIDYADVFYPTGDSDPPLTKPSARPIPILGLVTNYLSFSVNDKPSTVGDKTLYLRGTGLDSNARFYYAQGGYPNAIVRVTDPALLQPYDLRVRLIRQNNNWYSYVGDTAACWTTDGTATSMPYYIAAQGSFTGYFAHYDDISTLPSSDTMIGVIPNDWYVAKDITNPFMSGVYDATDDDVYSTKMHATYSVAGDPAGMTISIDGDYQVTPLQEWVQGATVREGATGAFVPIKKKCGIVEFDLTTFLAEDPAPYGVHTVQLKSAGGAVVAEEEFWYKPSVTSETNITFDHGVYAPHDAMRVNTSISNMHWGQGTFYATIRDLTTGDLVEQNGAPYTWAVTTQYQTHDLEVDSAMFPASGQYQAELYGVGDQPGMDDDIFMDNDICHVYTNRIVYCGYVYDAFQTTVLQGVAVAVHQGGTTWTDTTGDDGYFEIAGLQKDTATTINFTKTGYYPHNVSTSFPEYKRYVVEIGLIPLQAPSSGAAVVGVVYNAANASTVSGATVRLLDEGNLGQSKTGSNLEKTTNRFGYFCLNDTYPDVDYHLNATKAGFRGTNTYVEAPRPEPGLYQMEVLVHPQYDLSFRLLDAATGGLITDRAMLVQSTVTSTAFGSKNYEDAGVADGTTAFADADWGAYSFTVSGPNCGVTTGTGSFMADTVVNVSVSVLGPPGAVTTVATTATPSATPTPSTVTVHGVVKDAYRMPALAGADGTLKVSGATRHATSGGDGTYSFASVPYNAACEIDATLAGYDHDAFTFTTFGYSDFPIDLYLIPDAKPEDWTLDEGKAGVAGIVVGGPFRQILPGASVGLSNGTWSATPSRDADGSFWHGGLEPTAAYSANGSYMGYVSKSVPFTTGAAGGWTDVLIVLDQVYSVTVHCHDADKIADYITLVSCRVECSSGAVKNTTGGIATFPNLQYGTYTWTASATGYSTNGAQEIVYKDGQVVDIFLQKTTDTGSEISYSVPPHNVRFICQNFMAVPIAGVGVSAIGTTTTVPDRGIFDAIFGWTDKYTNASLTNTAMHDTTASDGSVVFLMTELMKYRVTFTPPSGGANQTIDIYPQESVYIITMGDRPFEGSVAAAVNATAWADAPEGADATLHVAYDDPAGRTAWSRFIVRNGTGAEIHNATFTGTASFPVAHVSGASYVWGVVASHQDHGIIEKWNGITLHSRLIDLGLEEVYYTWISIAAIIMFTAIFSGSNSKYGYVLVPLFAGILWWIGWMPVSFLVWSSMLAVGVIAYFTRAQGV